MKEDLLKLKKELELERKKELKLESEESEQKAKKYGLFSSESGFYYNPEFGRKTLLEIKRLEDTDGFIEQFENFAKDIIRELVAMNQQFDVLKFASFTFSLLCDADCAYKLLDIDSREEQDELILANSCLEYIPIDFEFFNLDSGYYDKDGNFISLGYDSNIHYKYPDRWEKIENFSKKLYKHGEIVKVEKNRTVYIATKDNKILKLTNLKTFGLFGKLKACLKFKPLS